MRKSSWITLCLIMITVGGPLEGSAQASEQVLRDAPVHLREGDPREWSSFPEQPDAAELVIDFKASQNAAEQTLRLRQRDVKQQWSVRLNDRELGRLVVDENPMTIHLAIPAQALHDGKNTLRIQQQGRKTPDDIEVGPVVLLDPPVRDVLHAARIKARIIDSETSQPIPGRITVLEDSGALASVGAQSSTTLAVRPGVLYTSTGDAEFGLPPGRYTIHAGRGFEWGLATDQVVLAPGESRTVEFAIRREVPTPGYVACDTHVHTLTHSGHGDATITERMITIAGEGIELPIATDHNKHIDYRPTAGELGVDQYFTPVIGNEVTTPAGHFNIFPVQPGAPVPDHRQRDWAATFENIYATPNVKAVILNHARDLHSGTRPFGPKLFNAATGRSLDDRPFRFNAMELINSGATQTDPLELCRDWFALLNRGLRITPVGSSDSHDVARHFIGQGRTYIRCDDENPGKIDVKEAVDAFVEGKVSVSYGLLADVTVDDRYRSGDLAPAKKAVRVHCRVLGPSWSEAERFALYANGTLIREAAIDAGDQPGVKWEATWEFPAFQHDVHLVGVAIGPGISDLYWPTAKPYQPDSPEWFPRVVSITGVIWLDADGDGSFTSAKEYAETLMREWPDDVAGVMQALAKYDSATAAHVAAAFDEQGHELTSSEMKQRVEQAPPAVRHGFDAYRTARRDNELARMQ